MLWVLPDPHVWTALETKGLGTHYIWENVLNMPIHAHLSLLCCRKTWELESGERENMRMHLHKNTGEKRNSNRNPLYILRNTFSNLLSISSTTVVLRVLIITDNFWRTEQDETCWNKQKKAYCILYMNIFALLVINKQNQHPGKDHEKCI